MSKLIFIDLETTGLDTETCEVIECAISIESQRFSDLFKPSNPIPPEVSGVTNIDNLDVEGKGPFAGSDAIMWLQESAEDDYIAVTHNTDFDLAVLERYRIHFKRSICTHKLAWKLLPELANHKLGTLRAYFGIPHGDGVAHRADYDVAILEMVFWKLAGLILLGEPLPSEEAERRLVDYSDQAKAEYLNTWHFGKFKGQKISLSQHADYIYWNLNNNQNLDPKFRNYLISLCP